MRNRGLQCEINEGLNVVESRNRNNSIIFFGKGGDIATKRCNEQGFSVLCLRVQQSALVCISTLTVQDVLARDDWAVRMTDVDRRASLFSTHVAQYGESASTWSTARPTNRILCVGCREARYASANGDSAQAADDWRLWASRHVLAGDP